MTADPELLLTVQGVDVTPYVWDWGSLRLTDSWNQHATLAVDLRTTFTQAASLSVPAFADVRLVNLLTGEVLFEGVQASDLAQRTEDPHWIVTPIAATGYGSLLDTAPMQADYVASSVTPSDATTYPDPLAIISAMLSRSFADARVPIALSYYPVGGMPLLSWGYVFGVSSQSWSAGTPVSSCISDVIARTDTWNGAVGFGGAALAAKVFPVSGLVCTTPSSAFRGASAAVLTGSRKPAIIVSADNAGEIASGVTETGGPVSGRVIKDPYAGTSATNGYLVSRSSVDVSGLWANSGDWASVDAGVDARSAQWVAESGFAITTSPIPEDILVGHSVTFDHPYWGTVTGAVQSVTTQFRGGVIDTTATGLPYMLNSGRSLDGTWSLDATAISGTERHPRVHTVTVAAMRRTFLGSARKYGLGIRG